MSPYRVRRDPLRPADWSMDLLNSIRRTALEPAYRAEGGTSRPLRSWPVGLAAVVLGVILSVQGVQTVRAEPAIQTERADLIARIQTANVQLDDLRQREAATQAETRQLQAAALGTADGSLKAVDELAAQTGQGAVKGPGVVIVVDDAEKSAAKDSRVVDVDLRQLANGLWLAGAEAIAINGHRLSARTAIRGAGSAITVDYRSLTRPYRVEAIGDPKSLQAKFVASPGGAWWASLNANYGMRYELSTSTSLALPADPGLALTVAHER